MKESHDFDLSDMVEEESDNGSNDDEQEEQEQEIVVRDVTSTTVGNKETLNSSIYFISNSQSSQSDVLSSPFIQSSLPFTSASSLRRHSHIPEGTHTTNTGTMGTGHIVTVYQGHQHHRMNQSCFEREHRV